MKNNILSVLFFRLHLANVNLFYFNFFLPKDVKNEILFLLISIKYWQYSFNFKNNFVENTIKLAPNRNISFKNLNAGKRKDLDLVVHAYLEIALHKDMQLA